MLIFSQILATSSLTSMTIQKKHFRYFDIFKKLHYITLYRVRLIIFQCQIYFPLFSYKFHHNNFGSEPTKTGKSKHQNAQQSMGIMNLMKYLWPLTEILYCGFQGTCYLDMYKFSPQILSSRVWLYLNLKNW